MAYWQLVYLIFSAFYLDHKQNDYLNDFFTSKVTQDVCKLKYTLEIVQSLLSRSEITKEHDEYAEI